MIGTKLAHYQITSHLGSGGMGDVYQATDSKLGRSVAIKLLPEAFARDTDRVARFEREARVLASLNHPHIAAIYGFEKPAGQSFLVMELVRGETLAERIKRGPLPVDEALGIAKQICEALESAHETNVVHRDLKPANVKITPDGRVKVLDFGLAKAYAPDASDANLSNSPTMTGMAATNAGVILGSAAYMSPEQAKGRTVDKRTDIFAFGCVLYEMLTGRQAFAADTVIEVLSAVIKAEPDWSRLPGGTPPHISYLLRRCLEKDPSLRLRDIGDARLDLTRPGTTVETAQSRSRNRLAMRMLAGSVAGLIIALAVILYMWRAAIPAAQNGNTLRFSVLFREGVSILGSSALALSPDGTGFAFTGIDDAGGFYIGVRNMESGTIRRLPGTEGGIHPFWSPDSRYVGFFANAKLRKVNVEKGAPQFLGDSIGNAGGGAWSTGGVIIWSANEGLYRITDGGGEITAVTSLDKTRNEVGHFRPQFLPDGAHFLFWAKNGDPAQSAIYVGSLDGRPARKVMASTSGAQYVSGHLLYVRDGVLSAQPFDPTSATLYGQAHAIADEVQTSSVNGTSGFAVADTLLVVRTAPNSNSLSLSWVDRRGTIISDIGPQGNYAKPVLSPNQEWIAVERADDIWLIDAMRGRTIPFTSDPAKDYSPVWSPDSAQILFSSRRLGKFGLYLKQVNGTGPERLVLSSDIEIMPRDWSGERVAFTTTNTTGGRIEGVGIGDIGILKMDGSVQHSILATTRFAERDPHFSPDGQILAYTTNETGKNEVVVQGLSENAGKVWVSVDGGAQPRWAGDSRTLTFMSPANRLMIASIAAGDTLRVTKLSPLFDAAPILSGSVLGGVETYQYDVREDAKRFLFLRQPRGRDSELTAIVNWRGALKP